MQSNDIQEIRQAIARQASYGSCKVRAKGKYRVIEVSARKDGKLKIRLLGAAGYWIVESVSIDESSNAEVV
jgi:hypothetical protein